MLVFDAFGRLVTFGEVTREDREVLQRDHDARVHELEAEVARLRKELVLTRGLVSSGDAIIRELEGKDLPL